MSTPVRCLVGLLFAAILGVGGLGLIRSGLYGYSVFIVLPVVLGGLASWVFRPTTDGEALVCGAVIVTVAMWALLAVGMEGLGCLIMVIPLALPLGALGGWLVYRAEPSTRAARGGVAMLLILPPASLTYDAHARPQVFQVRSAIAIAATPEQVWKHVITFSELPEPDEWFFRAGLAYPIRARIEGSGVGAIRYCEFSTGPFVEPIEVWDEPHLLRFRVTLNPSPLHEWSPYANVLPRHLHGYFVSQQGRFQLTRLPGNHTLLEGTTWYRHGLWPAQYWRLWSDAIIHRIHLRVLNHIRNLAEQDGRT